MSPGPRHKSKCPLDIHFTPDQEEREILDHMGSGRATSKIQYLIAHEGRKRFPTNKRLLEARFIEERAMQWTYAKTANLCKEKLREMGLSDDSLQVLEEEALLHAED